MSSSYLIRRGTRIVVVNRPEEETFIIFRKHDGRSKGLIDGLVQ